MIERPTRLKPQTASEAKATMTRIVSVMVRARAISAGARRLSQLWSGETRAMMNTASASGAKTTSAWEAATDTPMAARSASEVLDTASDVIAGPLARAGRQGGRGGAAS